MITVIKRDGREMPFSKERIVNAVLKAFVAIDGEASDYAQEKANHIAEYIEKYTIDNQKKLTVEEIQDLVEKGLMSTKRKDVAKAYVTYRHERDIIRTRNSTLRKKVMEKLTAANVQNQNANADEHSFGGRMGEANSVQARDIALNDIVSPMSRDNHLNNMIYIHDLDSYVVGDHNCLSVPFDKLLKHGFNTRQTDVRPAQSVNTAFQLLAVIFQLQSLQQFGGVSATHLDWTMVPYVRKSFYKHFKDGVEYIVGIDFHKYEGSIDVENTSIDNEFYHSFGEQAYRYAKDLTTREVYQAVEGMYHNLNTLQSRSGNQLPFTSINYGTCVLLEGRLVTKALLELSIKGIGKLHKTSIFPCGIFQCMKGVNRKPGDPNYDLFRLALKSTAKRLYPNYANVDWSGNAGYDVNDPRTYFSTMGCRTANGWDINGLGQLKDGRGNICPVTIILPTLAMQAKEYVMQNSQPFSEDLERQTVDKFLEILDQKIHEAKDMLIERFDWICSQDPSSAQFMYENRLMEGYIPEEGIKSALKHGTLAVG